MNNDSNPADIDKKFISTVGATVTKSVFYICLTIVAGMMISTCSLNKETIDQCDEACDHGNYRMESVTFRKCVCVEKDRIAVTDSQDVWVIPR